MAKKKNKEVEYVYSVRKIKIKKKNKINRNIEFVGLNPVKFSV